MREGPTHREKLVVALVGNPNTGKSTIFNALTGLHQKVSNYPGVTVEKKTGRFRAASHEIELIDLPGTYSLNPRSPDEVITTDCLSGHLRGTPPPDRVVCVVNAAQLERGLFLASQIIDRGIPVLIALNMVDVASSKGIAVDPALLSSQLGVPVVPLEAQSGKGVSQLRETLSMPPGEPPPARWQLPEEAKGLLRPLSEALDARGGLPGGQPPWIAALDLVSLPPDMLESRGGSDPEIAGTVRNIQEKSDFLGINIPSLAVDARYAWIRTVAERSRRRTAHSGETPSDRLDRILTHRYWGPVIFLAFMALVFQSIFSWAALPMGWISAAFQWAGGVLASLMPPGELRELIVQGGIAGVSAVVSFLPQILLLFFFLGILEESGYMARAAYIMDRVMGRFGLHGKSFIPLLSSFACAIPGIMAARTIDNPRDRLVTMLVAPLMSCSARLPVYTLLIAAFIPSRHVLGVLSLPALTLFSLYLLGLLSAFAVATVFKRSFLKGAPPELFIELPPYRIPSWRVITRQMVDRAMLFLRNAGTIILAASVILWFLASHPRVDGDSASERLQRSYAGQAGRALEPLIAPLGFDWKIGVGLVTSLLQREIFVSTMGTIYGLRDEGNIRPQQSLIERMRADQNPVTGVATFTTLTAICLMVYYVLSMQCVSTIAVMRRETNGWKWPLFQVAYMTTLAYGVTFLVYHLGTALGMGG